MPDAQAHRSLKSFLKRFPLKKRFIVAFVAIAALLGIGAFAAKTDMAVSGWFYEKDHGFYLADHPVFLFFHWVATDWARVLACVLAVCALYGGLAREKLFGVDAKGWLFLFLALAIGPGLIANAGFKDHWGRARPREIVEFGGHENFTPTLEPQTPKHGNGSFISGDAAFGFFLPSFAYVVPHQRKRKTSRAVFWGCMLAGCMFGLTRIAMGAHFFSDVLFAAFFMILATAILHMAMYGRKQTAIYWREWFFDARNVL